MQIIWHGKSCFTIKSKSQVNGDEINILVNPFDSKKSAKADIVLLDNKTLNRKDLKSCKAFIIDSAGEFEIKNNFIRGINENENIIFLLETEEINIVNLGKIKHLENGLIDKLQNVDILMLSIDDDKIDKIMEIINQIEPRIIIPMNYKNLKDIGKFVKKMNIDPKKTLDKLKINKKNLPQDGTEIITLDKKA